MKSTKTLRDLTLEQLKEEITIVQDKNSISLTDKFNTKVTITFPTSLENILQTIIKDEICLSIIKRRLFTTTEFQTKHRLSY